MTDLCLKLVFLKRVMTTEKSSKTAAPKLVKCEFHYIFFLDFKQNKYEQNQLIWTISLTDKRKINDRKFLDVIDFLFFNFVFFLNFWSIGVEGFL